MNTTLNTWQPNSWRNLPAAQQPVYRDAAAVNTVLAELAELPPLVVAEEVDSLQHLLAEAAEGKRFLLQGGDCAEAFADCRGAIIQDKLRVLLQMSVLITHGGRTGVIHLGRIAGQYAKPRSGTTERIDGREVPVYRGDLINGLAPDQREADPNRLLEAYHRAAATLNHLRALVDGGFADLQHPEHWDLSWSREDAGHYLETLDQVQNSLNFVQRLGGLPEHLRTGELFTSHEALHLPFETALTRFVPEYNRHYNLGAHFLWVGERTRQLDGAHLEYLRGIANPIGLKVGASMTPDTLRQVLSKLDPERRPGRLTLITRFGADKAEAVLPALIEAARAEGHPVLWSCDPMHGNGRTAAGGIKTRAFGDILQELQEVAALHRAHGSRMGAVHFELTGEPVTECTGGMEGLDEASLQRAYRSGCDPRLNRSQSLEMAFLIAQMIR
ncbi:3-deoxy-7-phosphoheptulonate synthase class II [Geothrix sp. PMB-07]|uniref:3-deoxy-7-phosphoheptulonate synthase class II n=1 Tax=Geothrix sp. PMB-07 TaxID=3068640 RepID=UPI00274065BB|nr:3-deoxy-7-phosphoheptulonate synthase class II [Geothrix sp. PMB-07]WLT32080.1 3-deoxy-7-phosphoheptulonate synthase class II [Geothrix sp. PMB-07]